MKIKGFSLIELLSVIAIISILTGWGLPGLVESVNTSKDQRTNNEMIGLIHLARSSAIDSGIPTILCPSNNLSECENNWNLPLIVFNDQNNNKILDAGEALIRSHGNFANYKISFSAFGGNKALRFYPSGMTFNQNGTFLICRHDSAYATGAIAINRGGRPNGLKDIDGDKLIDLPNGKKPKC